MLEAHNLSIALDGRRRVVHDVDLAAAPGGVTIVLGPNGSGKTTLLRALSGELPYAGRIALNGRDLRSLSPWEAAAMRAVLPQASTLDFPFTVREIVAMGQRAGASRLGSAQARTLPERALEQVDLAGFGHRVYQELSGGEQQRVQFARVLCQVWSPVEAGVPRYLFLDEPVSSLDIRHQLTIMHIARDFADRGGGVLAILHDLNLAAMFADHVVLMLDGRVAVSGTPQETISDLSIAAVFGVPLQVGQANGVPFVLPRSSLSRGPL